MPMEYSDRNQTAYFRMSCDILVDNGWSIYPQAVETREPETVQGRIIKPFVDHGLDDHLPYPADLALWKANVPAANVAGVMGAGSNNAMAVDLDVYDAGLAARLGDIATQILGPTPLKRVGQAPKIALIYRNKGGLIQSMAPKAETGGHGIDILTRAQALTFFGIHYRTGRPFRWIEGESPLSVKSAELPEITREHMAAFVEAVSKVMPLAQTTRGIASGFVPEWHENVEGKIDDGREKYLFDLVRNTVNGAFNKGVDLGNPTNVRIIMEDVLARFAASAVIDGRWSGANLGREISSRVNRMCEGLTSGKITPYRASSHVRIQQKRDTISDEFSPTAHAEPLAMDSAAEIDDQMAPEVTGHDEALISAQNSMAETIQCFMDQSSRLAGILPSLDDDAEIAEPVVRIIKAPPGLGKTSTTLRKLAEDPNTYMNATTQDGASVRAPYVMLVPTYRNVDELRTRAAMFGMDARASDFELEKAARAAGIIDEESAQEFIRKTLEDIRDYAGPGQRYGGFKVEVYQGRVRAGCAMSEQMDLASKNGGGSALCKGRVKNETTNEIEELVCEHYIDCPAITQRSVFKTAHLVLMPHAFASLAIPEEAKTARGIIIDERIFDLFLHTISFPADILRLPRQAPLPTRQESAGDNFDRAAWQEDLSEKRRHAVDIVTQAMKDGEDFATAFFRLPANETGAMIHACRRLCAASMQRSSMIKPNMTIDDVRRIIEAPTGHMAGEEWRFWTLISGRLAELTNITLAGPGDVPPDARIQVLLNPEDGTKKIRMSWRTSPNWLGKPLLLIDASAAPEIIAKVWGVDPQLIEVTDLVQETRLYERIESILVTPGTPKQSIVARTLNNHSIVGPKGEDALARLPAAVMLSRIRNTISAIATRHANGRVLVGATIAVRRAINESWASPPNVDWGHFGALRGIDAFKNHVAAISIGRLELPPDIIDGLAASLTYDDPEPEQPLNFTGTGYHDGKPIRQPLEPVTVPLRGGGTAELSCPYHPGSWGRLIQTQYREEELLQFLGRLRVFYRTGRRPTWYAISSVLPDGAVLDDILTTGAIVSDIDLELAETFRRTSGHLDEKSIATADPYLPRVGVDRCISKVASLGELLWVADGDGYVASSVLNTSPTTPDKMDGKLGTMDVRRARETRITDYLRAEEYAPGYITPREFGYKKRALKITPKRWRAYGSKNGGITKLDYLEMQAFISLSLLHAGTAALLDPLTPINQETRDYAHFGDWDDVSEI